MHSGLLLVFALAATDRFDIDIDEVLRMRGETSSQVSSASFSAVRAADVREQYLSLENYLDYVPGFDSRPSYLNNSPAARGVSGSLSLLIDGVVTNSPYDYRIIADQGLFLEEFERIEITTGPAGVLWGPYSLFGAVNLLSDDSAPYGTSAKATAGTRSQQRVSVRHDQRLGPGRLKLFVGYAAFQRPSPNINGAWTGVPPYSLRYNSEPGDVEVPGSESDMRLVMSARFTSQNVVAYARFPFAVENAQVSELGGVLDSGSPAQRRSNDALAYVSAFTSFANNTLTAYSRLTYLRNHESIDRRVFADSPQLSAPAHDRIDFDIHRFGGLAELRHVFERSNLTNRATAGVDGTVEALAHSNYYVQQDPSGGGLARIGPAFRTNTNLTGSVYGLNELALWRRLSVGAGVRYNLGGDIYRNVLMRQAGLSVSAAEDTFVRVVFTEGMRPPQFPDRLGIAPIRGALLRPERSSALLFEGQGMLPLDTSRITARVAVSRSVVDNLIVRDSNVVEPFAQLPANGVGYLITAVESTARWARNDARLTVDGTYRFNQVSDRRVAGTREEQDTAALLNNRCGIGPCGNTGPRHRISLGAQYRPTPSTLSFARGRLECGGRLLVTSADGGSTPTIPAALSTEAPNMPCYGFADLGLRWAFLGQASALTFSINNLTDTRPPVAFGTYPELRGGAPDVTTTNGRVVFVALEIYALAESAW
jgi:hypothetical protein